MDTLHRFKQNLHLVKCAFTQALQNGWKPVEAPWLPEGTTWSVVDVSEEGKELYVFCTTHKQFHTITSWYKPEDRYVQSFLFQPDFAKAMGYKLADLEAWTAAGNEPIQYVKQFVEQPV